MIAIGLLFVHMLSDCFKSRPRLPPERRPLVRLPLPATYGLRNRRSGLGGLDWSDINCGLSRTI
jgi:hypothetical protein